jgi:serine/threonine protein kinase
MSCDDGVHELLSLWQREADEGHILSAEELCQDCPELLPQMRKALAHIQKMNQLVQKVEADQPETPRLTPLGDTDFSASAMPVIPGYQIEKELGRGGMGVVFQALDTALQRQVAIKMILGRTDTSEEHRRFLIEARAVASLNHPHIVQVFAFGEYNDHPYLIMERVDGPNLKQVMKQQPQSPREAARLILLLARAMQAAHAQGILHRDLKPGNVLLGPPSAEPSLNTVWGCPKIVDFGLARRLGKAEALTKMGTVLGTPNYMSPEQAEDRRDQLGPPTDVYALGAILYELLTGQPPYVGKGAKVLVQVIHRAPRAPRQLQADIPAELEAICLRCLQKKPAERYASMAELAEELQRFLQEEPLQTTVLLPATNTTRPTAPQRRWLLAAGLVLLLALPLAWQLRHWFIGEHINYVGQIDLLIQDEGNPNRQLVWLDDPEARPLRKGDQIQLRVHLNQPAYIYILWIDAEGHVQPVYPWHKGDWQQRPAQEKLLQELHWPQLANRWMPIDAGPAGTETVILLARPTPLPAEVDLSGLLGELPPQPLPDEMAVAWFENGQLKRQETFQDGEAKALPRNVQLQDLTDSHNPLLRNQALVWERLQEHFPFMLAVAFGNKGG